MSEDRKAHSNQLTCPNCGSRDVRRSKQEGVFALLQRTFGRHPFRCRNCRIRFFRKADLPSEKDSHP